jgi:hypothetical protein
MPWYFATGRDKKNHCKHLVYSGSIVSSVIMLGLEPRTPALKGQCSTS